jgi:para-nitrobenzyl esterase
MTLCFCGAASADFGPIALTRDGLVQGVRSGSMLEFLGIPYAAPPVGNLRWQVPQPVQPWWGIREATAYGPHCPQNASAFGVATQTEDCLYLNVYVPTGRSDWRSWEGLPVMFWIHGGSLDVGESDDYVPTALVERGVVVVTINYRLGLLGYLVHPALAYDANGAGPFVNYGIRDQQAALAWVRDNIRFFGGDPHNVTVFGESAGGLSTFVQIVSPLSNGLIHKAIVESGSYSLAIGSLAQNEATGEAVATALGCSDQSAACLRALPVSALLAADAGIYYPTVDGSVLPQSIGPALASGQFNRVPVMQGTNHDEWRLFVAIDFDLAGAPLTAPGFTYLMDATFGSTFGGAVLAEYPVASYPSADLAYGAVGTDYIFACPSEIADQAMAQYVPVFAYEFSDPNAPELFLPPASFPYAAAHASELQYLFSLSSFGAQSLSPAQQALAATMVDYWTGFAKDSNPNRRGVPFWPTYTAGSGVRQSFIPNAVMPEYDFNAFHQCSFWIPALEASGE